MNVLVLAGGLSPERDVSVVTGRMVCESLKNKGHKAVLVDLFFGCNADFDDFEQLAVASKELGTNAIAEAAPTSDELSRMRKANDGIFGKNVLKACKLADIVFIALHGAEGENGKLQAVFDSMNIKYTGSGYIGSAIAMNKSLSKIVLKENGVRVPEGISLSKNSAYDINDIELPCVIKPCSGGSSVGVSIIFEREQLKSAICEAFKYEDDILIERYINGREFSVAVMEKKALPIIEIIPQCGFYDYANKYQSGRTLEVCPAELDEGIAAAMQKYACEAYNVLMLNVYARVDFLLDEKNELYCLEANTLPGMTNISLLPQEAAVLGMSHADVCEKILLDSYKRF